MMNDQNSKQYDLEERTFEFARRVRDFVKRVEKKLENVENCKQVLRSSGSIGANYIEANEALSRKDFLMRIKICRKESKKSVFWLKLLNEEGVLTQEARELTKIFGAILEKSK